MSPMSCVRCHRALPGLKIWQQAVQLESVGDIIYDADRVLAHRTNQLTKRREFLIRWSGFSADFDSWQSEQSIRDTPLLPEYWNLPPTSISPAAPSTSVPAATSVWLLASPTSPLVAPRPSSVLSLPTCVMDPHHTLFADAFRCCCLPCLRAGGVGAIPLVAAREPCCRQPSSF